MLDKCCIKHLIYHPQKIKKNIIIIMLLLLHKTLYYIIKKTDPYKYIYILFLESFI